MQTERLYIKSMRSPHYAHDNDIYFELVRNVVGMEVGYMCIQNLNTKKGTCSIAYRVYKEHQRHGYMKEAISCFIEFIFEFLPITTIYADSSSSNEASLKVLEGAGFQLSKEREKRIYYKLRKGR